MPRLTLLVPGPVVAQPRRTQVNGRSFVPRQHPVHGYRDHIRLEAKKALRDRGLSEPLFARDVPCRLDLEFFLDRPLVPAAWAPVGRPDIDNLEKAVMDALKGVFWHDDCQVVTTCHKKRYGDPGVRITITTALAD